MSFNELNQLQNETPGSKSEFSKNFTALLALLPPYPKALLNFRWKFSIQGSISDLKLRYMLALITTLRNTEKGTTK